MNHCHILSQYMEAVLLHWWPRDKIQKLGLHYAKFMADHWGVSRLLQIRHMWFMMMVFLSIIEFPITSSSALPLTHPTHHSTTNDSPSVTLQPGSGFRLGHVFRECERWMCNMHRKNSEWGMWCRSPPSPRMLLVPAASLRDASSRVLPDEAGS